MLWKTLGESIRNKDIQTLQKTICINTSVTWPDGHDEIFQGFISGELSWPMGRTNGHGFDPVFKPNGYKQTFGEMDRWKKHYKP